MRGEVYCWEGWCCLEIPIGWTINEEGGIISLTADDGVGALQLSFARREKNEAVTVTEAILVAKSFAASCKWVEPHPQSVTISGSPAAQFEYRETTDEECTYWCVWCAVEERRAVTITYVSAWADHRREKSIREQIVGSFRWI